MPAVTPPSFTNELSYTYNLGKFAKLVEKNPLCNFAGKCEAEVIVRQTISAAQLNYSEGRLPCSFLDLAPDSGMGLVENGEGFDRCMDRGWFKTQKVDADSVTLPESVSAKRRKKVTLLWPTPKLFADLTEYFKKK